MIAHDEERLGAFKKRSDTSEASPTKLLNYDEVAAETGLSVSFLKRAKWLYKLPHYKIGAMVRFRLPEVETWLRERKATK